MLTNKLYSSDDCGLFSAAYCTALVNGHSLFVYHQDAMRPLLVCCLENKKMDYFPIARNRRNGTARYDKMAVYCMCRYPDDGSKMIQCGGKNCSMVSSKLY